MTAGRRYPDISGLLTAWNDGDEDALNALMPLVYDELRRRAKIHMRQENPGHTLQPTAIVHEVFIRLVGQKPENWKNRAHFLAVASQFIRRILVDHARARHALKRGGNALRVERIEALGEQSKDGIDVQALDSALEQLSEWDAQQSRIVELRFFGGLTIEETAEVLKISPATVKREWAMARAWLYRELTVSKK